LKSARAYYGDLFEHLSAIIIAQRDRGECIAELQAAAHMMGHSLQRDEFVWLKDEIERLQGADLP
jgi:hypothetical protein